MFCSFLALAMQKHLDDLLHEAGVAPEWKELLRDLDRLQIVRLDHHGADWLVRADASRQAHIALPPRAKQTAPPTAAPSLAFKRLAGRFVATDSRETQLPPSRFARLIS